MASVLEVFCTDNELTFIEGGLILRTPDFQVSQSTILAPDHIVKSKVNFNVISHIPQPQTVEQACETFTAHGYEGVVLRYPQIQILQGI